MRYIHLNLHLYTEQLFFFVISKCKTFSGLHFLMNESATFFLTKVTFNDTVFKITVNFSSHNELENVTVDIVT